MNALRPTQPTAEEVEVLKKAIFDKLSPRRQAQVLKRGYDEWDPFMAPNDPIDIRMGTTGRTAQQLAREFLRTKTGEKLSDVYVNSINEMSIGLYTNDERARARYEFGAWYHDLLKREGHIPS